MKRLILASAMMIATGGALAAGNAPAKLSTEDAKVAYSIGYLTGKTNSEQLPGLDVSAYVSGFKDAYSKKPSALSEDEMKATLTAFKQKKMAEAQAKYQLEASANGKKGEAFLATNGKKPGVKTTASGLQYEVLSEGKGAKPVPADTVKVDYEGKLIDGTVFDSSIQRHEPATFQLDQVIPGWTEGLQLMTVGSKYRFTIPAAQAYGEQGAGPIPPNSVLVFEVTLLDIVKPDAKADTAAPTAPADKK